jgi:hypothetical protein
MPETEKEFLERKANERAKKAQKETKETDPTEEDPRGN